MDYSGFMDFNGFFPGFLHSVGNLLIPTTNSVHDFSEGSTTVQIIPGIPGSEHGIKTLLESLVNMGL